MSLHLQRPPLPFIHPSAAVLVTGATGKTGRRVVKRLAGRGVAVRAAARSGRPPFCPASSRFRSVMSPSRSSTPTTSPTS
jgi:hypothetical protein